MSKDDSSQGDEAAHAPAHAPFVLTRRIDVRERRGWGFAIALVMGLAMVAILTRTIAPHEWFGFSRYWSFGLACAAWCAGLAFTWQPRAAIAKMYVERGLLHLGDEQQHSLQGMTVQVARAASGFSIAIGTDGAAAWFVEVESEADARRLLDQLGVRWPGTGNVTMKVAHPRLVLVRKVLALLGVLAASIYAVGVGGLELVDLKAVAGVPALACGVVASVLFLLEPLLRKNVVIGTGDLSRSAKGIREHARLQRESRIRGDREPTKAPEAAAPTTVLEQRAGETVRAWMARIDALSGVRQGYRGGALSIDELERIAEDETLTATARLGALRLLALRRGDRTAPPNIKTRVAEDLGAQRVRVMLEATASDEAADELEALGPLFRA